jgi:hypothetical protein
MADWRGKLVEYTNGRRAPRDTSLCRVVVLSWDIALRARNSSGSPFAAIVDIHDTTGTTNSHPAISAKLIPTTLTTKGNHGITHGTGIQPARDNTTLSSIPLRDLTVLAGDSHTLTIRPPSEVSHTSTSVNAHLRDPLGSTRVQNVDHTAALARCTNQTNVPSAGRYFEALHGLLFFLAVCGAVDFVHLTGVQVPDVEVAAATGGEDSVSARRGEG